MSSDISGGVSELHRSAKAMDYETVFDVTGSGYSPWYLPLPGVIILIAGALIVTTRRCGVLRPSSGYWSTVVPRAALVVGPLWLIVCALDYRTYRTYVSALRDGTASYVEGRISSFVPEPPEGHAAESFVVGGKRFEYSSGTITRTFNHTAASGGPIEEGLEVRIWYVGRGIIKVQRKRPNQALQTTPTTCSEI